ncbi:hypothetical protein CVCC1112_2043 [Paenarthrobacter nicotinovorans]|nr:hypothetical protein ANMWB30_40230 [Arthrobacter sp. MWB30]GAT87384.1 hypothetical protein CVCC1112_2043 [Paenarthrobacter nicotinovorans]
MTQLHALYVTCRNSPRRAGGTRYDVLSAVWRSPTAGGSRRRCHPASWFNQAGEASAGDVRTCQKLRA